MINISLLKSVSRAKKYLSGNVFGKDVGTELYIVLKGEVGVFLNYGQPNQEMITTSGSGEFFVESEFFMEKRTPVTAVALTDVYILPISKNTAAQFIKDEPELVLELIKELCSRLDKINIDYEKLSGHPWVQSKPVPEKLPASEAPKSQQDMLKPPPCSVGPNYTKNKNFSLLPEGHGDYQLTFNNEDHTYLMDKSYTCPLCKKTFNALKVKSSKLVLEKTDNDMRSRYKDVEPLYYDVVTCPHCFYSALSETFDHPDKPLAGLLQELQAFKPETKIMTGREMDTFSIFAGYYLALFCAPKCFVSHRIATAKLLLKLSRIYQDCEDITMEGQTAKLALEAYLNVYMNEEISPALDQQLCLVIGELYLKTKDFKNAKDFFLKAKLNRDGAPLLKNQAENRILDIRAMEAKH